MFIFKLDQPSKLLGFRSKLNLYRNKICKQTHEQWKRSRFNVNVNDFPLLKYPSVINRAFYKYWEIIQEFEVFKEFEDTDSIFHIAEAPGGFIQASNYYLEIFNKNASLIYTMSINKKGNAYNSTVLKPNVCILYGHDGTGDICNIDNTLHLKIKNIQIVTADGGFDEKLEFNQKEQLHYKLIFHEILSAIIVQKIGGIFILKIFDIYTITSLHLLYLLFTLYEEVIIYKPQTSRPTNSEKYVICKKFKGISETQLKSLIDLSKSYPESPSSFRLFSDTEIPLDFVNYVRDYNTDYISKQCEYLSKAISNTSLIDSFTEKDRSIAFYTWRLKYLL